MRRVAEVIGDKRVLRLIGRYPRAGVLSGGVVERSAEGTPQGGPLSPLLANIYLDAPDRELESRVPRFRRYADDCNIYVGSEACAEGDQGLDREASATEGERGQERGGEAVGAEVSGVSSEPPRAGGSGAGKYRTIPTEGAGDLARRPIGHESAVTRRGGGRFAAGGVITGWPSGGAGSSGWKDGYDGTYGSASGCAGAVPRDGATGQGHGTPAGITPAGHWGTAVERCFGEPRRMAHCGEPANADSVIECDVAAVRVCDAIGSCGVGLRPLGSTAGYGKPYVRWCGRVTGPGIPVTRPDGCGLR